MESIKEKLSRLLKEDSISEEDRKWLLHYLDSSDHSELRQLTFKQYCDDLKIINEVSDIEMLEPPFDRVYQNIRIRKVKYPLKKWIQRISVAASILIAISLGYYAFREKRSDKLMVKRTLSNDINPGGNKALLTLGDGTKIVLSDMKKELFVNKGSIVISKNEKGQIIYDASQLSKSNAKSKVEYNTISTPKAGQYQVVLSDGTRVWLNALSSIRFPTCFTGSERNVEITGEAYFEVTKNRHKPFKVLSGNQSVEVLGTHFNINAYKDEDAVKTTLLEGSVKIFKGAQVALLSPGQQACTNTKSAISIVNNADIEEAVSWKNGMFKFKDASIQTVMKQIERWYDVTVKYEGEVPVTEFNGKVPRDVTVSKLLDMFSYLGVRFRIQGRTIVITNLKINNTRN